MSVGSKVVLESTPRSISVKLMTEPSARCLSANNSGPSKKLSAAIKRSLDSERKSGAIRPVTR